MAQMIEQMRASFKKQKTSEHVDESVDELMKRLEQKGHKVVLVGQEEDD